MLNKTSTYLCATIGLFSQLCWAEPNVPLQHSFYVGALAGWGSTTWEGLVPTQSNLNFAMMMSTPIKVKEGGATWGVMAGYEITPSIAIEANYIRYPRAQVFFDETSLFFFNHNGLTFFNTHAETISLIAKFMAIIPNHINTRLYSGAGIARLYRHDIIINDWMYTPTFEVGITHHFTDQIMGEIAGNYTTGFGDSRLNPTDSYFPFLYALTLRLAYFFNT